MTTEAVTDPKPTAVRPPKPEKPKRRFRLLNGTHYQDEVKGIDPDTGKPIIEMQGYLPGAEVETTIDLVGKHNQPGFPPKWEEVGLVRPNQNQTAPMPDVLHRQSGITAVGDPRLSEPKDTYDVMTDVELRKHAESEEIDISSAKNRDEILTILRGGMVTKVPEPTPKTGAANSENKRTNGFPGTTGKK